MAARLRPWSAPIAPSPSIDPRAGPPQTWRIENDRVPQGPGLPWAAPHSCRADRRRIDHMGPAGSPRRPARGCRDERGPRPRRWPAATTIAPTPRVTPSGRSSSARSRRASPARPPARRTASPTASTSSSSAKAKTRSGRWSASSARRSIRPTAARPGRCTTRFRSPTGPSTTPRSGARTSRVPTTKTCCSTMTLARSRCATSTRRSRPTATR